MPAHASRLATTGPDGVPTLAEVLDRLAHAPTHVQVVTVLAVALLAVLVLDAVLTTVRVLVRTAVRALRDRGRSRSEDAVPPWVRTADRTRSAVPPGPGTGPTDPTDRTADHRSGPNTRD
jgi:hypothetical protein